jgi:quercetin dioxygenase-like cupin family protein
MTAFKTTLANAPKMPSGHDAYKMYSSPDLDIVHLHLGPGENIGIHVNPVDVIFCILEGKGHLQFDDTAIILEKHDVIQVDAGLNRGMSNPGRDELRILVIKKMSQQQAR